MAIVVMNDVVKAGKAVRVIMYEEDEELTGTTFATQNAGTVECEAGTIAFKVGLATTKQLGTDGSWH